MEVLCCRQTEEEGSGKDDGERSDLFSEKDNALTMDTLRCVLPIVPHGGGSELLQ